MGGTQTSTTTSKSKTPIGEQIAGGVMTGVGLMSGVPGIGMLNTVAPGMGLIGGGLNAGNTSGAYHPDTAAWAPNQGLFDWGYTIKR
jgi:hypothetical protein